MILRVRMVATAMHLTNVLALMEQKDHNASMVSHFDFNQKPSSIAIHAILCIQIGELPVKKTV